MKAELIGQFAGHHEIACKRLALCIVLLIIMMMMKIIKKDIYFTFCAPGFNLKQNPSLAQVCFERGEYSMVPLLLL